MNNVALENVKDFAFLADRSYRDVKSTEDKEYKPSKHLPKEGVITNPATNSNFEVYNQADNYSSGFSATVFRNIPQRRWGMI